MYFDFIISSDASSNLFYYLMEEICIKSKHATWYTRITPHHARIKFEGFDDSAKAKKHINALLNVSKNLYAQKKRITVKCI